MDERRLAEIKTRYELLQRLAGYATAAATVPGAMHLTDMTAEQGQSILILHQQILSEDMPALLDAYEQLRQYSDRTGHLLRRETEAVEIKKQQVERLQAAQAALLPLLRRLYDVAAWAQNCTPETLADTFGDISGDLARAEALLQAAKR